MNALTTKDFGPIRDEYAFFAAHATEAENDLAAYLPGFRGSLSRRLASPDAPCRLLDFGCGPGAFTATVLDQLNCPPDRLLLSVVEPQPGYLHQAGIVLRAYSTSDVRGWEHLPPDSDGEFDIIFANHVLYYVPDLDEIVPSLVRGRADGGLFQTAIAGHDNVLIQFWVRAFAMLGRPVPYHTAESVAATFGRHGIPAASREVSYRLSFPDTPENRSHVLRFLLGEHFQSLPEDDIRSFFNPYASAGTITIDTTNRQFSVP